MYPSLRAVLFSLVLFSILNFHAIVEAGETVVLVAGNGDEESAGDGGLATQASFSTPHGVAVDAVGNVYVTELTGNRIRRINAATGIITTIAGTGVSGYSGDGGPAILAQLQEPSSIAVDASGVLIFTDQQNQRLRQISADGTITTIAGSGVFGSLGANGPALEAEFRNVGGVALDAAGLVYICDIGNDRILRVDRAAGTIAVFAGTGVGGYSGDIGPALSAQFNAPGVLEFDFAGNLYVADCRNHVIRRIGTNGIVTTVAGTGTAGFSGDGGPATQAQLQLLSGNFVDSGINFFEDGDLLISDSFNNRLRRVDAATGIITTIAGTGFTDYNGDTVDALSANLLHPTEIVRDLDGNFIFSTSLASRVRKLVIPRDTLTILSGPTATPNPATVGTPVNFAVSLNNLVASVTWNFGDGSPAANGSNVTHTFAAAGSFQATVTASIGAQTIQVPLSIEVLPEPVVVTLPLTHKQLNVKFNFTKQNKDSLSWNGTLELPPSFQPAGKTVSIQIGSLSRSVVLDARARGGDKNNSFQLSGGLKKGVFSRTVVNFKLGIKNQTLFGSLSGLGFNQNSSNPSIPVLIEMTIDGNNYSQTINVNYRTNGKSGSGRG